MPNAVLRYEEQSTRDEELMTNMLPVAGLKLLVSGVLTKEKSLSIYLLKNKYSGMVISDISRKNRSSAVDKNHLHAGRCPWYEAIMVHGNKHKEHPDCQAVLLTDRTG